MNEFEWEWLDEDTADYIFRVSLRQIPYDLVGGGNDDELFAFQADCHPATIFNVSLDTYHPSLLNVVCSKLSRSML